MMKRAASLTLFLLILAVIAGVLLSQVSWVGRAGMSLFYKDYNFLKVWYQGAALYFVMWMTLYALQSFVQLRVERKIAQLIHLFAIAASLVGLYLSYSDFRHDMSHRLLGERFHIGVYLFWIGWIIVSIYLLLSKKNKQAEKEHIGMEM